MTNRMHTAFLHVLLFPVIGSGQILLKFFLFPRVVDHGIHIQNGFIGADFCHEWDDVAVVFPLFVLHRGFPPGLVPFRHSIRW